ncbi:MAG TPA: hypothetical protein VK013_01310 [Myxococcaceae bacterium]|nr:hypothetical protein [Myxococcaceae bacterium]
MTRIQSFVQYELPKQLKGADSATATGKQAGAVESKPVEAKSIDGFDRGGNFTTALGEGGSNPPGHVTLAIGENGEGLNLQGGNGGGNFTTALGEGGSNPPGHVTHAIGEDGSGTVQTFGGITLPQPPKKGIEHTQALGEDGVNPPDNT